MTTASTKRNPDPVNGVVGPAVTKLSSVTLSFTPFPVSPDIAAEYRLETPRKTYVTGVFGFPDIKEGDILIGKITPISVAKTVAKLAKCDCLYHVFVLSAYIF